MSNKAYKNGQKMLTFLCPVSKSFSLGKYKSLHTPNRRPNYLKLGLHL